MKIAKFLRVILFGTIALMSLSINVNAQVLMDIDGNSYKTLSHGIQVWTAANLNVSHFRNGDAIPEVRTDEEWAKAARDGKPAWCYYENVTGNGLIHGRLYNWYAVNDQRGLAPKGWHIADNRDWSTLVKNLFGVDIAGTKLKDKTAWKSKPGTNDIGFNAIPSGYRQPDGKFTNLGTTGRWWSNSVPVEVKPSNEIYSFVLENTSIEAKYLKTDKGAGLSIRCEKD